MAIQQIGSKNPAALDSSLQLQAETLHQSKPYDAAHSSLVSLSQPQEEGLGDFLSSFASGVWSLVTWPFRTLGSIWSWMTGAKEESSDKTEGTKDKKSSGGGGGKVSEASSDFVAAFKKDEEFDSDNVKKAYGSMSADEKRAFRTMLWIAGGHRTVESGTKDWATRLMGKKGEFDEREERILRQAADMYKAAPRLQSLAGRMARLADDQVAELDEEDSDKEFEKDLKKLNSEFEKLPPNVKKMVAELASLFPAQMLMSRKESEREDDREAAMKLKGKAFVMQLLARSNYLFVGDADARDQLARMLRVVAEKGFPRDASQVRFDERHDLEVDRSRQERRQKHESDRVDDVRPAPLLRTTSRSDLPSRERSDAPRGVGVVSEGDFVREYNMMGKGAQKALAEVVGYMIGRPEDGEKYMKGTLVLDGKKQVPNMQLLCMALAVIVKHDGSEVPESLGAMFGSSARRMQHDEDVESVDMFSARQPTRTLGQHQMHRVDEETMSQHSVGRGKQVHQRRDEMSFASPYPVDQRSTQLPRGVPFSIGGGTRGQTYTQHLDSMRRPSSERDQVVDPSLTFVPPMSSQLGLGDPSLTSVPLGRGRGRVDQLPSDLHGQQRGLVRPSGTQLTPEEMARQLADDEEDDQRDVVDSSLQQRPPVTVGTGVVDPLKRTQDE